MVLAEGWVVLAEGWVVLAEGWVVLAEGWVVLAEGWVVLAEGWVVLAEGWVVSRRVGGSWAKRLRRRRLTVAAPPQRWGSDIHRQSRGS
ncbi:hypothetical protein GCM10009776_02380 [Microbacterium deminutum]|uniref:Uncharacterized protein n=1 Tax=Microbacterium deminutum TaxID=344164 RepID=A0ABN2Q744_9MICO